TMAGLDGTGKKWIGQQFNIVPIYRKVATLAVKLIKVGTPTGIITLAVVDWSSGLPIISKVWGDAADLPTAYPATEWQEVEFDTPTLIDVISRMGVSFSGGGCG
ncbi:unnamed protein product, partial [marine sediment metagenome]